VEPHPAAVAAAVEAGDRIPQLRRRSAIDAQVVLAAELDRRIAHGDADALLSAGSEPPQLGGRERRRGDRRLRHGADRKRRRQHRVGAGEGERFERGSRLAGGAPQCGESLARIRGYVHGWRPDGGAPSLDHARDQRTRLPLMASCA
jgi:hypothetical protein